MKPTQLVATILVLGAGLAGFVLLDAVKAMLWSSVDTQNRPLIDT